VQALLQQDPGAHRALAEFTAKFRDLPPAEAPQQLLSGRGHKSHAFQIRSSPYDYAGQNSGNANMSPNVSTGELDIGGLAGEITGGKGDTVSGICFTGMAVTNQTAAAALGQTIRVAPQISWKASWDLGVAGLPTALVGSDPWAECSGGVHLLVFDSHGLITQSGPIELFSAHYADAPGDHWNHQASDGGATSVTPQLEVYFAIPAGETRWVNIDAYINIKTNYSSVFNQASATAGLEATVNFIVLTPQ
jgi:hypothetical protein